MIAINNVLLNPYAGGIATYMTNIIQELNSIIPDTDLRIYLSKDQYNNYKDHFKFSLSRTPLSSSNSIQRVLYENFYWNNKLKKDKIKLFHSPISYIPFNLNISSIVTIHDLRVFRSPETYPTLRRYFLNSAIKHSINSATKIITVSNFTKNEIIDIFNVPSEKIEVIYEGVKIDSFIIPPKESDINILNKYNIKKPYIFTVGHLEPRKNFLRLIKAFEILNSTYNGEFQLVIGGRENFYFKYLYEYVIKNNLKDRVIFTGFIPNEDLPILYKNARVFVFPSTYEGFGFPPLESLASGVPVAASNVSSIPEVLGDAASYFNPYSIEEISESMIELIENIGIRTKILDKSTKILKQYTWKQCAEKTYATYRDILSGI